MADDILDFYYEDDGGYGGYEDEYEYEEYEEEEEVDNQTNANAEWYYDEEDKTLKAPPQSVLQIIGRQYSQTLLVDKADDAKQKDEPHTVNKANKQPDVDSFSAQRTRGVSTRHKKSAVKTKQSPNMMAISVIKGLFQSQPLSQLTEPLQPEDLENIAPILEAMISGSSSVPSFIIKLFQTTLDNMFGELKMDFDVLNNDYLYVKSVFVDNGDANNSSIRFERIMKLIQNAKITTLQIRNVHLTQDSFENIIKYIANDDNYDQENYLQNSVNQILLHRKSGLKYSQIQSVYADQFAACGWEMYHEPKTDEIVIRLNFSASWEEVYDEDYEDEDDAKAAYNQQPPPPMPPISETHTAAENGAIPPPPSGPPPKTPQQSQVAAQEEYEYAEDEYEYYYENEDGTTTAATGLTPMMASKKEDKSPAGKPVIANKEQKPPAVIPTALPPAVSSTPNNMPHRASVLDMEIGVGGMGGFLGLPPPDSSDDDVDDKGQDKSDRNKVKFLSETLMNDDYDGKALFNGMLLEIVHAMQRMDVNKGQCIMKETEYGQNYDLKFFVVEYGVFQFYQQGRKMGLELFAGSTFGESHLIYGIPQFVTIRAATNKCLVWWLSRSQYYQISWRYFHRPYKNRIKTQLAEFQSITTLGTGSFGRVLLVRDPHSKKTYCLKKLAKNNVIQNSQQKHIMNERSVMTLLSRPIRQAQEKENRQDHRVSVFGKDSKDGKKKGMENTFCCKLFAIYQDKYYLYFCLEPLLGGELFTLLRHNKRFSEKVARFYLSCIIVAFDHVHQRNIIYRDIKPENIMLASNGYCKLVDFGLAKLRNNSVTCCGTPEYLAPEVIQNYWQGFELDFWGLGILLFEMIAGYPPFDSYEQILGANVPMPRNETPKPFSKELLSLINALLIKNPYQRLGTTANKRKGIKEIYDHPWFKGTMEWNALKAQKFRPPYFPDIENDEDVSNFEECDSDDDEFVKGRNETLYDDPSLYKWCEYF